MMKSHRIQCYLLKKNVYATNISYTHKNLMNNTFQIKRKSYYFKNINRIIDLFIYVDKSENVHCIIGH